MTNGHDGKKPAAPSRAEELDCLRRKREKRRSKRGAEKEIKNGLTSMIDIVFLLIFFFMVVTDLQNMEIEKIDLPFAAESSPEPEVKPKRIVINVNKDGRIRIMGSTFESAEDLLGSLRLAADAGPHDEKTGLPELAVKIRADRDVDYRKVQDVMVQCMRARLWRVSFGTRSDFDESALKVLSEPG